MRRALFILVVAAQISVVLLVIVAPSKTAGDMEASKSEIHKRISIVYGLHMALPDEMKHFPIELLPLP